MSNIDNLVFTWTLNKKSESKALTIIDDKVVSKPLNVIRLKYDYTPESSGLIFPYQIHYWLFVKYDYEQIYDLRNQKRRVRSLFSGNSDAHYYNSDIFKDIYNKLNRGEIVNTFLSTVPKQLSAEEFYSFMDGYESLNAVFLHRKRGGIKARLWLRALALSDFFLCPPGVIMPMCHNIIESMAVGTIPITNYPEWFNPPLKSGQNCFSFTNQDELENILVEIGSIKNQKIEEMRQNVIDYYDQHLDPMSWYTRHVFNSDKKNLNVSFLDEDLSKIKNAMNSYLKDE
jgi:hypothetical protein